ncbi:FERM, ARHGEF and pleckstrin domain-containing protein 1 [Takifugu flavidus]|uniref:FERM, ARHGEF and pleckstrin domain-containing protein 1 n=1 Tax=Takifugu flavidus TaxID=433684 RepID=A0A5C6N936_9TELE|nr:FERM, ARHGEF and pleckstrin domain-containing protein 1 [Takifugu flavidus]
MAEPAERSSTAGQRLGAPESLGVSTLEPGLRPPGQPPGRQVPMRVQLLDDTQEVFEIPGGCWNLSQLHMVEGRKAGYNPG